MNTGSPESSADLVGVRPASPKSSELDWLLLCSRLPEAQTKFVKQAPAFSCWVQPCRLESSRWWSESRSGKASTSRPHPRERQLNGDKGGEELTRRVCVGRSAGEGRRALQAEQHVRGPASGRRLARSRNREEPGKPRAAGEGEGRQRKPAKSRPPKLRPVSVPAPRSLSL